MKDFFVMIMIVGVLVFFVVLTSLHDQKDRTLKSGQPAIPCESVGLPYKSTSYDERSKIFKIQCEYKNIYGEREMVRDGG